MTSSQGKLISAGKDNQICIIEAANGGAFQLVKYVKVKQNPYNIDLLDNNLLLRLSNGQLLTYEDIMGEQTKFSFLAVTEAKN